MTIHNFHAALWLPRPPAEIFDFFANARNLQAITPEWLNFEIVTPEPITMRVGALIDYKLKVHGWPVRWRTKITVWSPPHRFVDEQKRGPYRQWIHEHCFEEQGGGTRCTDHVRYAVIGGAFVNRLFVRQDVERIFTHRSQMLTKLFGV